MCPASNPRSILRELQLQERRAGVQTACTSTQIAVQKRMSVCIGQAQSHCLLRQAETELGVMGGDHGTPLPACCAHDRTWLPPILFLHSVLSSQQCSLSNFAGPRGCHYSTILFAG